MTQLVLHAGDCKAGSTAIQSVLQAGSFETDAKLHYATAGRQDSLNHQRLSNALHVEQAMRFRDQAWSALGAELRACEAQTLIVSSERFEFVEPEALMAVLKEHLPDAIPTLKIVIYVRPHLERVLSGYVQNVKQGLFLGDIDGFISQMAEARRFEFAPRLVRWREVFGPDTVTMRPMVRERLAEGCVVTDFLGLFAPGSRVETIPQANASLSAASLDLVRRLWDGLPSGAQRRGSPKVAAINTFVRMIEDRDPLQGPKLRLSQSHAARLCQIYAQDARACDTRVFEAPVFTPLMERQARAAPEAVPTEDAPQAMTDLSHLWLDVVASVVEKRPRGKPHKDATKAQWRGLKS